MSSMSAIQDGSDYVIETYDVDGQVIARLNGIWATLTDARAAAARLVDAVDPADYA